jgi:hypothetical protein
MTVTQIQYLLGKMGYPVNQWTSFSDVTSISLMQDASILVEPETKRFRFSTTGSILEISHGVLVDNVFIPTKGTISVIEPNSFVPFSSIHGFVSSSYITPYGSLNNKHFLTRNLI